MPPPHPRPLLLLGCGPGLAMASTALPQRVEIGSMALLALVLLMVALALGLGWLLGWLVGRRAAQRAPAAQTQAPPAAPGSPAAIAAEANLPPGLRTLDLIEQPLLLLSGTADGDRIEQFNAAAALLRPGLEPGAPVRPVLDTLAPGLALATADAKLRRGRVGPWRWAREDESTRLWLLRAADDETDQLSFSVSHDLRAPVRVVEGFTRIVKEDYGTQLDRVANDHLDRVLGAAARMNAMIDSILKLAKLSAQPLHTEPVNLSQMAAWVVDDLRRQQPERGVQVHIAPDLAATGDPTLLRVVLENLLGNAWKYSGRNPQAQIAFERSVPPGRRAFVVRDNGAGFDMRGAERLFGLFQRLHSAGEFPGHGVGLASVRRIVLRHGGQVWAESEPGQGASFYFTLGD